MPEVYLPRVAVVMFTGLSEQKISQQSVINRRRIHEAIQFINCDSKRIEHDVAIQEDSEEYIQEESEEDIASKISSQEATELDHLSRAMTKKPQKKRGKEKCALLTAEERILIADNPVYKEVNPQIEHAIGQNFNWDILLLWPFKILLFLLAYPKWWIVLVWASFHMEVVSGKEYFMLEYGSFTLAFTKFLQELGDTQLDLPQSLGTFQRILSFLGIKRAKFDRYQCKVCVKFRTLRRKYGSLRREWENEWKSHLECVKHQ